MGEWNRTGVFVVPENRLDQANQLANCFESCHPSAPVFVLQYQDPGPPHRKYALAAPALRTSSISAMLQAVLSGEVNRPAWDALSESIDLPQAVGLLALTDVYEHNPEDTEIDLPNGRMWIGFDMSLQQVVSMAGLIPLQED